MEELFEERRKGKAKPCIELLLAKEDDTMRNLLGRRHLPTERRHR